MAFFEKPSHLATVVSKTGKTRFPGSCWRGPMGQKRRPVEPRFTRYSNKTAALPDWGPPLRTGDMVARPGGVKGPAAPILNERLTPLL